MSSGLRLGSFEWGGVQSVEHVKVWRLLTGATRGGHAKSRPCRHYAIPFIRRFLFEVVLRQDGVQGKCLADQLAKGDAATVTHAGAVHRII